MRKFALVIIAVALHICTYAQSDKAKQLVQEGTAFHDKGEYENALKKYDEAIAEAPDYIDALYEKTFTYYAMRKYDECIDLSKQLIKKFSTSPILKAVYVQYGSSLDDQGKPADAIKVYNEGLKKFPGYFLLHFNKGITYTMMDETDKAYESYQAALISNPFHSSSYFRVAELLKITDHLPAAMACIMHLILDPKSERAALSFDMVQQLIYGSVKRTGEKSTTITMDIGSLDKKKNKKDDFSMQEMMYTLSSALDKDSVLGSLTKTEIEKFDLKLQLFINSLGTSGGKGFFKERYVPFFQQLKENKYTMVVSHLIFASTKDEANATWLRVNTDPVDRFYDWLKAYKWPE